MTKSQFCVSVGCDGFRKSVSGRIDSSALSLFLLRCSFSLTFSLFLLPSVFLSLLPVLAFLPSFSCNKFVGRRTQNKSSRPAVTVRIFMFVRSRKNLHTCKLPLAGLRSPIVKYARGSHIGFAFPLYKPDTFVRASNAQVRCLHYLHKNQSRRKMLNSNQLYST